MIISIIKIIILYSDHLSLAGHAPVTLMVQKAIHLRAQGQALHMHYSEVPSSKRFSEGPPAFHRKLENEELSQDRMEIQCRTDTDNKTINFGSSLFHFT